MNTSLKPVDLADALIVGELLSLPDQLETKETLYKDSPDQQKALEEAVEALGAGLFAMNEHRRNYKINEKAAWKEFKREGQKSKTKDENISKHVPELQQYVVGFFSEIKPSLDALSKAMNVILGSSFKEWDNSIAEDNIAHSGKAIGEYIKANTPENKAQFGKDLEQFVNSNTRWLGYLTTVVDKKDEQGNLTAITPFVFEQKHRTVIPQLFTHSDGYQEPVLNFMNRATQELILFMINTLVFSFQIGAKDLFLTKMKDKAGHQHYRWVPLEAAQKLQELQKAQNSALQ